MPINEKDYLIYYLVRIIAGFFLFLLIWRFAVFLKGFTRELRYLNNEIVRSEGAERKYWLAQKRRLWCSLIPFVKY